jgi:uncharacterized protein YegL
VLAALLAAATSAATAAPALAATTTGGSASPGSVALGAPTRVSLTVHGANNVTSTPTDVIFVLDESGSIASTDFAREKTFTANVIQGLSGQGLFAHGGQVGIVQFSTSARLTLALSSTAQSAVNAANSLVQNMGNTCISCALVAATNEFGSHSAAGHNRLVILVTDGFSNVNTAAEPAAITRANAHGIMRFAIGVGPDVDPDELRSVASQVPGVATVFQQPDWNSLSTITQGLVASVTSPAATNVQVTATVADGFTPSNPVAATLPGGVRGTATVSGQTVTWTLPSLGDETATLSYTVTPKAGAPCGPIPVNSQVTYTDAQGGTATFDPITVGVTGCASGLSFPETTGTHSYGDAPFPVTATGGPAGTPVTIAASGTCTVETSVNGSTTAGTVTVTAAGTCTLTATQAGAHGYADGSVTRTFAVAKATPVITWSAPTAMTYGTPLGDAQLNATATVPGLADAPAGTWSYTVADGTNAHGRVLNAGQGQALAATFTPTDTANFNPAAASTSIDVTPAEQKVTFGTINSHKYGDDPFTVTATGGRSNSPITFAAGAADICTLSGATAGADADGNQTGSVQVALTGAGGCTLTASQAASADGNYLAGTATGSVSVDRATPDLAWNPPAHVTYGTKLGDAQLNAAATFAGEPVAGSYAYTPAAGTTPNAGELSGTVTFTPDNTRDFTTATVARTITVDKADQTITFPALGDRSYGQDPSAAPVSGGGSTSPVTLSTPPGAVCSVSQTANGWVVGIVHAGDCEITASQAGDGNYNPATSVKQTLHIAKAKPTMSWLTPDKITYGSKLGDTQLAATADVAGTTAYTMDDATGDATDASPTAGVHTLHAVFAPTDTVDYTTATASVQLTVEKATPTLTWPTPDPMVYGTPLDATQLAAKPSFGGQPLDGRLAYRLDDGNADVAGAVPHAGTHTLHATFTPADAANFHAVTAQVSLDVAKAAQAITFEKLPAHKYGDEPFAITAVGGGSGNPVTFSVGDHNACKLDPQTGADPGTGNATVTLTGAGECTVVAAQAGNGDYNAATNVPQSFTVDKATPALAWAQPKPINYGTKVGSDQLNASASFNGQPVAGKFGYALPDGSDPTGTTPNAGQVSVSVTFTPDDATDFTPASAQVILDVLKADQVITVAQPGDKEILSGPFSLGATGGGSGTAVTYTASGGACAVDAAGKVSLTALGTCSITLAQAGSANYNDAAPVTVAFAVTKVNHSLEVSAVADHTVGDLFTLKATGTGASTPVRFAASPWSVCLAMPSGIVLTLGGGVCTVTVTQAGDANYNPSPAVTRSFTVSYGVKVLTDFDRVVRTPATLPIELQLVTAYGLNVSSPSVAVTAVSLDGNPTVPAAGNTQPGQKFALSGHGYRYNLKTAGLAPGTHTLVFTAGNDPVQHTLTFTTR